MEVRARYVQMGAFTLAVLALGFGFVYWLNNAGGLRGRAVYRVSFAGPVSGLLRGSAVLFNGIRVGEVTALEFDPGKPQQVLATIAVDRSTPVRADTQVGIDFQGLTGSPVVALAGGSATVPPLVAGKDGPPVLVASAEAGQSMSLAARDVLRRLDAVLTENAEPLRSTIANLETFAGALARNADRVDGIAAGLERMTGGAAARARVVIFDLGVPRVPGIADKASAAQLVVADPSALAALDSEKIQTAAADGSLAALPDAQWSDTLPQLLQTKLVRSLEDSNAFAGVSRPLDELGVDFRLAVDIRAFQVGPDLIATVELGGKVIEGKGRIVATRVFHASAPVASAGAPAAVAALDQAFAAAGAELVAWTARALSEQGAPKGVAPKKATGG